MKTSYVIGGLALTALSLALMAQPKYDRPYWSQTFKDTDANGLYDTVKVARWKKDNGRKDGIDVLLEESETKLPIELRKDQISPRNIWSFNGLDKRVFD